MHYIPSLPEDCANGWFSLLRNATAGLYGADWPARLDMDRSASGIRLHRHGLSKIVYWRDTRRAIGPAGFKLLHTQLGDTGPNGMAVEGTPFADTVALGDYNDDCHHLACSVCQHLAYLLTAGSCMVESFRANANTRLHPSGLPASHWVARQST